MLTNSQVMNYQGSNLDLCNALGITRKEGQPDHWMNFTVRPLKIRATEMVAHGKGDEEFQVSVKSRAVKGAQHQRATAMLPSSLLAIMPALAMKTGTPDVKDFIAKNSTAASMNYDAQLPLVVIEVLAFFNLDSDSNRSLLLDYAGVKTYKEVLKDNVIESINVLQDSIKDMDVHSLERLKVSLIKFSMGLDLITDNYGNQI